MHNMLQILGMAPEQRTTGILAADGIFILTATLFFCCGHQFGLQRNGPTVTFPGPMVELDGTRRAPDFFVPYVFFIILASILTPLAGLGYLVWEGQADLGISTLGVYLLCLVVQIASESVSLRLGEAFCSNTYSDTVCPPDPGHPLGGWGDAHVGASAPSLPALQVVAVSKSAVPGFCPRRA
ncbi:TPA: hypothetical protein ACH3X1_014582 [Trebouxia sp. C0004]